MYKSKDLIKNLSKLAADAYLRDKKAPLAEAIVKIAQQEGVPPVQIPILTAETNQNVWKTLYDTDKKGSYGFEPADPEHVVAALQSKPVGISKVASADYLSGPSEQMLSDSLSLTLQTYGMDKVATDRRELRQTLQNRLEKMSAAKEELQGREIVAESAVESLEGQIVKQAKQMLMEIPFSERPQGLDKIAEVVRAAMLPKKKEKEAARLIVKISALLRSHGLVKAADLKAPEEYISKNLPVRVVNGRHPLYVQIDTLTDKWSELEQIRRGREIVDSSLPQLKEKIRGL
jgi:hypothetical protein